MPKMLDETKDYATVHGSENRARYHQDGCWFDSEKRLIPFPELGVQHQETEEDDDEPKVIVPEGNNYRDDKTWKMQALRVRHREYFGENPPAKVTKDDVITRIEAFEAGKPDPGLPSVGVEPQRDERAPDDDETENADDGEDEETPSDEDDETPNLEEAFAPKSD